MGGLPGRRAVKKRRLKLMLGSWPIPSPSSAAWSAWYAEITASKMRWETSLAYSGSASDSKQVATGPPPCVWLAPIRTWLPGIFVATVIASRARAVASSPMKRESIPTSATAVFSFLQMTIATGNT